MDKTETLTWKIEIETPSGEVADCARAEIARLVAEGFTSGTLEQPEQNDEPKDYTIAGKASDGSLVIIAEISHKKI